MNANISVMYMKKWCPGAEFDAYPQRQFVTESININSLADHHIWSTMKTLPATLPELRSVVQGPSFENQGLWFEGQVLRTKARVSRTTDRGY